MLRDQLIIGTAFFVPVTLLVSVARSVTAERREHARATGVGQAAGSAGADERARAGDAVPVSQQAA